MKTQMISLVFMILYVHTASAFRCYQCPATSSTCADPFSPSDSGDDTIYCEYGCVKAKAVLTDTHSVSRGCFPVENPTECHRSNVDGVDTEVCICNSDLCNAATHHQPAPLLVVLMCTAICFTVYQKLF
ncbi:uncharacterized protein LOC106163278 [Lingula anatina]|uniref:Uncharacterized protein LOC106163278 n=1 Tax=Lingula anatina TaxID=7574 RepID=A0A2R2MNG7_LINAN|nr:uncharacterized protein LOC106163278 [Lingula anatina]|eukprot:XP_023931744.1 uncharacterized protein LOC106163278 [Lingula anatina]